MSIYVYIHACTYTYNVLYLYVYEYFVSNISIYLNLYVFICINMYMCLYMCIYIRTHTHTYTVTHTYIILRGHFMHLNWIDVVWSSCLYVTLEMTLGVSLCGVGLMLEENQDKEIVIRKVKPGSNADRSVYQENSVPEILQCVAVCCCTCSVVLHCVLQIEC